MHENICNQLTLCLRTPTVLTAVDTFCHLRLFCAQPGRGVEPGRRSSFEGDILVKPENFKRKDALLWQAFTETEREC